MIARYSQIQQQVQILNSALESPGHIQKIQSTSRYLCIQVRLRGRSIVIGIGRGNGFEGLWIDAQMPKTNIRIRDRWLEWVRKNLSSAVLISASMDVKDRIIQLRMKKTGETVDLYIGWMGRNCYFALGKDEQLYTSWSGMLAANEGFNAFDSVGRRKIEERRDVENRALQVLLEEEEKHFSQRSTSNRKSKAIEQKIKKIEEDIRKLSGWRDFKTLLESMNISEIEDKNTIEFSLLKIKFPVGLSGWKKRELAFEKIKKFKAAELNQVERLKEANRELNEKASEQIPQASGARPTGPIWKYNQTKQAKSETAQCDDYIVLECEGYKIGVGKSANGNDQLRNKWGADEDWWVHAAHSTSAHAVIKANKSDVLDLGRLKEAARVIAKQSGITSGYLEIVYTQLKNVRGVTGTPGMVTYKKEKRLLCEIRNED